MKKQFFNIKVVMALLSVATFMACIEPIDVVFEDFESAIVVEATITDQMEFQRVFLTRSYEFEADGPSAESNANISVVGGGNTYNFVESSPGVYRSAQAFAAQSGTAYQLRIQTQDGRNYSSSEMTLSAVTQIDEVRAERLTNDLGEEGIGIFVDSFDPSGNAVNYRYQYEESYRIIAPFWTPLDLEKVPPEEATELCEVRVIPDVTSEQVCYRTDFSQAIIQTNTSDLDEDRVSNFMVRFINRNNYIISHRYSILVRQFVQSNESFNYYETLNEFSGNDSFFSQTQPGFLEGNLSSDTNEEEKVLGYFDVSSVKEQRIFFNYEDLFPNEELPPYIDPCQLGAPPLRTPSVPTRCVLSTQVEENLVGYIDVNESAAIGPGPFIIVNKICGDCQEIGSVDVPEFWIEE